MDQGEALDRVLCVVIADDVTPDRTLEVVRRVWHLSHPPLHFEEAMQVIQKYSCSELCLLSCCPIRGTMTFIPA